MSTPSESPAREPERARRSAVMTRLLGAQESGLLLVILLMVVGLALGTPSIDRTLLRLTIEPGSTVSESEASIVVMSPSGTRAEYARADGWSLQPFPAPGVLLRTDRVNSFFNHQNLFGVAKDASFIAVMAVGMTGVIILGGIDLSVGSVYALAAVAGALLLHRLGEDASAWASIPAGLLACGGVGGLCGFANGAATVGLRVHPFIITLGGMAAYRGFAFVLTDGQSISNFPDSYTIGFFKATIGGVNPVPMIIMVVVALAGWFVLCSTIFGRQTYAIGGNETAARYAGVRVNRVKIAWFTAMGALAGLSAAMLLGYYGAASSDAGPGYELKVIAAAVVGGASLTGGRGTAIGAMLGAVVIQLIDNGIVILGLSNYTSIVIGLVIVLAVVVDQAKQRFTPAAV